MWGITYQMLSISRAIQLGPLHNYIFVTLIAKDATKSIRIADKCTQGKQLLFPHKEASNNYSIILLYKAPSNPFAEGTFPNENNGLLDVSNKTLSLKNKFQRVAAQ